MFLMVVAQANAKTKEEMALNILRNQGDYIGRVKEGLIRQVYSNVMSVGLSKDSPEALVVLKRINSRELENRIIAHWVKYFTPKELKQIETFVMSPAGRKFLNSHFGLTSLSQAEAAIFGLDVYADLSSRVPKLSQDRALELRKKLEKQRKDALGLLR